MANSFIEGKAHYHYECNGTITAQPVNFVLCYQWIAKIKKNCTMFMNIMLKLNLYRNTPRNQIFHSVLLLVSLFFFNLFWLLTRLHLSKSDNIAVPQRIGFWFWYRLWMHFIFNKLKFVCISKPQHHFQ